MIELNMINFKLFCVKFKEVVDPYKVVKCHMDSFDPYTYIDESELLFNHPEIHKSYTKFKESMSDEMSDFEHEYLHYIKG